MLRVVENFFDTREAVSGKCDVEIAARVSIVDSLIEIIPADITLDDAREERLSRV